MKRNIVLSLLIGIITHLNAQNVGIGTLNPEMSAQLDITSSNKGFLPPRMKQFERNSINNPAPGLIIWCSNCGLHGELQVYNGSNWTNACGGSPATAQYEIGDTLAGGFVFYFFKPGDPDYVSGETHGYVAAIHDIGPAEWGCYGYIIGGTYFESGMGQTNTSAILNASCNIGQTAANIANDYVSNGYNDWFLPSRGDLINMYQNLKASGIGNFGTDYYWSSTENSGYTAWYVRFSDGGADYNGKSVMNYVRPIRKF